MLDAADFIADLTKSVSSQIEEGLHRAYERGLSDGRRIASEQFKERLAHVLQAETGEYHIDISPHGPLVEPAPEIRQKTAAAPVRAPRGSVEPAVWEALQHAIKGKKPAEIAAETRLPENSVRGMLNKLRKDGRAFKTGDVWRPKGPILQSDGSFAEVTADGRMISTPAKPAVNGNPGAEDAGAD